MSQLNKLKFIVLDSNNYNNLLIQDCYNNLLHPTFSGQGDELDSYEDFSSSLRKQNRSLNTQLILIQDTTNDKLAACAVYEHYQLSNFVLNSYIVVDSDYRGMKLANALVNKMVEMLPNSESILILETDDSSVMESSFDVGLRLKIHHKLGYELIDFEYIQSRLSAEGNEVSCLLLLVHSSRKHLLTKSRLIAYLTEFYEITDSSEDYRRTPYWIHMMKSLEMYKDERVNILPYGETWFRTNSYKKSKL